MTLWGRTCSLNLCELSLGSLRRAVSGKGCGSAQAELWLQSVLRPCNSAIETVPEPFLFHEQEYCQPTHLAGFKAGLRAAPGFKAAIRAAPGFKAGLRAAPGLKAVLPAALRLVSSWPVSYLACVCGLLEARNCSPRQVMAMGTEVPVWSDGCGPSWCFPGGWSLM